MTRRLSRFYNGLTARVRTLRIMLRGAHLRGQTDRNIWNLYLEIFWAAILSAAASFNATFAIRLGASNTMIGWLSSVPALIAVLLLVPSARFLERRAKRTPWIWGSLFVARVGYGLIAALPWLLTGYQAEAAGRFAHRPQRAQHLLQRRMGPPDGGRHPGARPRPRDGEPQHHRRHHRRRSRPSSPGDGSKRRRACRWATFPANYQVVYFIGFLASVVSSIYLLRIKVPESKVIPRTPKVKLTCRRSERCWAQIATSCGSRSTRWPSASANG